MEFLVLMILTWYVVPILIHFELRRHYLAKVFENVIYSFHFSNF